MDGFMIMPGSYARLAGYNRKEERFEEKNNPIQCLPKPVPRPPGPQAVDITSLPPMERLKMSMTMSAAQARTELVGGKFEEFFYTKNRKPAAASRRGFQLRSLLRRGIRAALMEGAPVFFSILVQWGQLQRTAVTATPLSSSISAQNDELLAWLTISCLVDWPTSIPVNYIGAAVESTVAKLTFAIVSKIVPAKFGFFFFSSGAEASSVLAQLVAAGVTAAALFPARVLVLKLQLKCLEKFIALRASAASSSRRGDSGGFRGVVQRLAFVVKDACSSLWSVARETVAKGPKQLNEYVDTLRSASYWQGVKHYVIGSIVTSDLSTMLLLFSRMGSGVRSLCSPTLGNALMVFALQALAHPFFAVANEVAFAPSATAIRPMWERPAKDTLAGLEVRGVETLIMLAARKLKLL